MKARGVLGKVPLGATWAWACVAIVFAAAGCGSATNNQAANNQAANTTKATKVAVVPVDAGVTAVAVAKAPPTPPDKLVRPAVVGSWKTTGVGYASITLRADGTFAAHMHERPFASGQWKLGIADGTYQMVLTSAGMGKQTLADVRRDDATLVIRVQDQIFVWQPIK